MKVTLNFLSELTGKHFGTVKKHLSDLERDRDGKLDSKRALQILFGGNGDGTTHSEALRRLTIARKNKSARTLNKSSRAVWGSTKWSTSTTN